MDNNDLLFPPTPPMDLLSDSNSNSSHSDSKVSFIFYLLTLRL